MHARRRRSRFAKCNIGQSGQRIYHLPFDQQYDTTLIEPHKGEHWVANVAEARS